MDTIEEIKDRIAHHRNEKEKFEGEIATYDKERIEIQRAHEDVAMLVPNFKFQANCKASWVKVSDNGTTLLLGNQEVGYANTTSTFPKVNSTFKFSIVVKQQPSFLSIGVCKDTMLPSVMNDQQNHWQLLCNLGVAMHGSEPVNCCEPCVSQGDKISVILDREAGTLSFGKDRTIYDPSFTEEEFKTAELTPIVGLMGGEVQILCDSTQ